MPHYLIHIIHKTVKPSRLEKLENITFRKIIQNINKLMFEILFIFFDNNFDKANHSFLHFKTLPGVLSRKLGHE